MWPFTQQTQQGGSRASCEMLAWSIYKSAQDPVTPYRERLNPGQPGVGAVLDWLTGLDAKAGHDVRANSP